jgi:hypothetical protein
MGRSAGVCKSVRILPDVVRPVDFGEVLILRPEKPTATPSACGRAAATWIAVQRRTRFVKRS